MTGTGTPVEKATRRRAYHRRLVEAFVRHSRIEDVCKAVGLSRRTVQRWRADEANRREVERERENVLSDALARLREGLPEIADELRSVALDKAEPGAVRVRAAATVFETFARLSERVDLERRLLALEARGSTRPVATAIDPYAVPPTTEEESK